MEHIKTILGDGNLGFDQEMKAASKDLSNDLIAFLNSPRVELDYVDNDTLHYHQFMKTFEC